MSERGGVRSSIMIFKTIKKQKKQFFRPFVRSPPLSGNVRSMSVVQKKFFRASRGFDNIKKNFAPRATRVAPQAPRAPTP